MEVCARWISSHWKIVLIATALVSAAACSRQRGTAGGASLTPEQTDRARAAAAILAPLLALDPQFSSIEEQTLRDFADSKDSNLDLLSFEASAAAWSRSTIKRHLDANESLIAYGVLSGMQIGEMREQMKREGRPVLSETEFQELQKLIDEEIARRRLIRNSPDGFTWKEPASRGPIP